MVQDPPLIAETVQAITERIEMTYALVEVHPILTIPWSLTVTLLQLTLSAQNVDVSQG